MKDVRGNKYDFENAPDFQVDKKDHRMKKRQNKLSKANLTSLLNQAKLEKLEKTIAENNPRSSTPFESRPNSKETPTGRLCSEIAENKYN